MDTVIARITNGTDKLRGELVLEVQALVDGVRQRKWKATSKLVLTAGFRFDKDGGLYEKYGNLVNFDPSKYSYNLGSDTIAALIGQNGAAPLLQGGCVIQKSLTRSTKGISSP